MSANHRMNVLLRFLLLAGCAACATPSTAQNGTRFTARVGMPEEKPGKSPAPSTITLQQMVEPSFRIEPIVRRLEAKRGEVVPFSFTVESTGREIRGEMLPIALRQEEVGTVTLDESAPAPEALRITSPRQFTAAPGKPFAIEGELHVPQGNARFYSFGILVRDGGQKTDFQNPGGTDGKPRTQANVRFVTQYLLRCDVEVSNASGDELRSLRLSKANVIERDGMPWAQAYVENTTASTFEFRVTARFANPSSGSTRPFPLIVPTRAGLDEPERTLVRLLPRGRIRVESPLGMPLLPGEHALQLALASARETVQIPAAKVRVDQGQFPAQDVQVAQLGEQLSISPAQIELGQIKGGHRTVALTVQNRSDNPMSVHLKSSSLEGEPLRGLQLATPDFSLAPGRTRKISLLLHSQKDLTAPVYGYLQVESQDPAGAATIAKLPVAMLYGQHAKSKLAISELALRTGEPPRTFTFAATNQGSAFTPIHAQLAIADEQGNTVRLTAGYGRWLQPGETREVQFRLANPLSPGAYQVKLAVQAHENDEPLGSTAVIRIPGPSAPPAATGKPRPAAAQAANHLPAAPQPRDPARG